MDDDNDKMPYVEHDMDDSTDVCLNDDEDNDDDKTYVDNDEH